MKNEMQVQTDAELTKDAEHPIGREVHISTVTHAWRGILKHVTPNYFVFESGAVMVGDTGDVSAYLKNGKKWTAGQEESEPCAKVVRVLRASVAWIASE